MSYAELEIAGYAFRDENGILTIGIGGMGYENEKDPDKGWGILYSGFDSSIYSKIMGAFSEGAPLTQPNFLFPRALSQVGMLACT